MTQETLEIQTLKKRLEDAERALLFYSYAGNWSQSVSVNKAANYYTRIDYGDCSVVGAVKTDLIGGKRAREYFAKYQK